MRLQKYLSYCGIASRRKCEELILSGKIRVNGAVISKLGTKITENDFIEMENTPLKLEKNVYIMLNKPEGYITTCKDEKFNVLELVKDIKSRIYPVGRLDVATTGLLILTNDGDMAYKLTHPKHEIEKTYMAEVAGKITNSIIERLKNGILIDGYKTNKAKIEVVGITHLGIKLEIKISEGKNRQIRKMFEKFDCIVKALKRIAISDIYIGNLPVGKWRYLTSVEVNKLKK